MEKGGVEVEVAVVGGKDNGKALGLPPVSEWGTAQMVEGSGEVSLSAQASPTNTHEEGHCPWEESEAEPELEPSMILSEVVVEPIPLPAADLQTIKLQTTTLPSSADKSSSSFSVFTTFRIYRELWKTNLSTLVVTTTAIGWVASGGELRSRALLGLLGGTFLQSACANSINQLMEIEHDKNMTRTKKRPLPTGRITPLHAAIQAAAVGVAGSATLYFVNNPLTAGLGMANIFLYTCVYTPLKRKHWLNTWVGTINGCLPPLMGYTAVKASLGDNPTLAWFLFLSLYAWQIPHFMAISYKCGGDYAKAGFEMLPNKSPKSAAVAALTHSMLMTALCGYVAYKKDAMWFFLTSLPINFGLQLIPSLEFFKKQDYDRATNLFWGSLLHLPALFLPIVARGMAGFSEFLSG